MPLTPSAPGALFVRAQAYILNLRKHKRLHFLTIESPVFLDILGMLVAVATPLITFPLGDYARQPLVRTLQDLVTNSSLTDSEGIAAADWGNIGNVQVTLFLMGLLIYVLTFVSTTLTIPAGLFLPVMISGACWGRIVGEWMAIWFPHLNVTPAGYAVVGAAALGAGVTRTISTAVIVSEAVASVAFTVPVLLAVLLAVLVGNYLSLSVYDSMLSNSDAPYLPALNSDQAYHLTAGDVMDSLEPPDEEGPPASGKKDVLPVLTRFTTLGAVKQLLKCPFPRFNQLIVIINNEEDRLLLGSVNRKELSRAAQQMQIQLHDQVERSERREEHRQQLAAAGLDPERRNNTDSAIAVHDTLSLNQARTTGTTLPARISPPDSSLSPPSRWRRLFNLNAAHANASLTPGTAPHPPLRHPDMYNTLMRQRNAKTVHDQDDMLLGHYTNQKQGRRVLAKVDKTSVDLFDLDGAYVNPAPFQCVRYTPVSEISYMLSMLHAQYAFVTDWGQLVGVVTKPGLAAGIIKASERSARGTSTRRHDDADTGSNISLEFPHDVLEIDASSSKPNTSSWRKRQKPPSHSNSAPRTASNRCSVLDMDWGQPASKDTPTVVDSSSSPAPVLIQPQQPPPHIVNGLVYPPKDSPGRRLLHQAAALSPKQEDNTSSIVPGPVRLSLQHRRNVLVPSLMELAVDGQDVPLSNRGQLEGDNGDVVVEVEAMDVISEESDRVVTPMVESMTIKGLKSTVSVV